MNRSKPFLYSLVLHALLIALFFGAISTVQHISEPKTKIAVSILAYTPGSTPDVPPVMPPESVPVPPPKIPPITKTEPLKTKPTDPKPAPLSADKPAPSPAPRIQPDISQSTPLPASAPLSSKPATAEPSVSKASPPVDHQRAYEEEHLERIRTLLAQNLVYPKNARRLNQQGDVVVMFSLSPGGDVNAITITKSSGSEWLDDAARRLIETTAPQFPRPSKTVHISVPIGYKLR